MLPLGIFECATCMLPPHDPRRFMTPGYCPPAPIAGSSTVAPGAALPSHSSAAPAHSSEAEESGETREAGEEASREEPSAPPSRRVVCVFACVCLLLCLCVCLCVILCMWVVWWVGGRGSGCGWVQVSAGDNPILSHSISPVVFVLQRFRNKFVSSD